MDPNLHSSPGLHLPQPSQAAPPVSGQQPIAPPPVQTVGMPVQPASPPLTQSAPIDPAHSTVDLSEDQLDEEWVGKAKEVADHYRTDPYMQSRELAALKAQYLKVRYGKEVKTGKDQT